MNLIKNLSKCSIMKKTKINHHTKIAIFNIPFIKILFFFILTISMDTMAFGQFTSNPNLRQQLKSGTYKKDLIIPKGVLVVCKNAIVKFSSGHGIIVKQGGTLYIDHSIITHENDNLNNPYQRNTCGEYWKGIFVEGNPDSSQNIQYNKTCNL